MKREFKALYVENQARAKDVILRELGYPLD